MIESTSVFKSTYMAPVPRTLPEPPACGSLPVSELWYFTAADKVAMATNML